MGESPKNGSPPKRANLKLVEGNKNQLKPKEGVIEVCAIIQANASHFLALENDEKGCLQLPFEHLRYEQGRVDLYTCKDAIEKECIFNRLIFPAEEMEILHAFSYISKTGKTERHGVAFSIRLKSQWRPHHCQGRYLSFSELSSLEPWSTKLVKAFLEREKSQRKLAMKVSSIGVKVAR